MGNLLLTHVEGYGTDAAQTTTYEYDGVGNLIKQTNPNGHIIELWYDATGRITKTREPWHDDQGTRITTYTYVDPEDGRYSSDLAEVTQHVYPAGATTMVTLSTETHTHTLSNGVKREEVQTTATGSSHTHLEITETWTGDAPNAVNGVQTWYTYTATSSYGALYTITEETRVEGEAVEGQSRRSVQFINEAGNTVREEEYVLLPGGTWAKISGVTHSYNVQNQRIGSTRDNGRRRKRRAHRLRLRFRPLHDRSKPRRRLRWRHLHHAGNHHGVHPRCRGPRAGHDHAHRRHVRLHRNAVRPRRARRCGDRRPRAQHHHRLQCRWPHHHRPERQTGR